MYEGNESYGVNHNIFTKKIGFVKIHYYDWMLKILEVVNSVIIRT